MSNLAVSAAAEGMSVNRRAVMAGASAMIVSFSKRAAAVPITPLAELIEDYKWLAVQAEEAEVAYTRLLEQVPPPPRVIYREFGTKEDWKQIYTESRRELLAELAFYRDGDLPDAVRVERTRVLGERIAEFDRLTDERTNAAKTLGTQAACEAANNAQDALCDVLRAIQRYRPETIADYQLRERFLLARLFEHRDANVFDMALILGASPDLAATIEEMHWLRDSLRRGWSFQLVDGGDPSDPDSYTFSTKFQPDCQHEAYSAALEAKARGLIGA